MAENNEVTQASTINFNDFLKVDIRVGQIVEVETPEWSQNLLKFKVNFGEEIGEKTILSSVKNIYSPEDFLNKKFLFVVNLAERQMGKSVSQGMILMADEEEKPALIALDDKIKVGSRIA